MLEDVALEVAFKKRRRVFHEEGTGTIRQCPQNYVIACKIEGRWHAGIADHAINPDIRVGVRDYLDGLPVDNYPDTRKVVREIFLRLYRDVNTYQTTGIKKFAKA